MRLVIDLGDKADRLACELRDRLMAEVPRLHFTRATRLVRQYVREYLKKRLAEKATMRVHLMEHLADDMHYMPSDLLDEARKAVGPGPRRSTRRVGPDE